MMTTRVADLMGALPEGNGDALAPDAEDRLQELLVELSRRNVPVGSLRRLWSLGGLQASLAAAYLSYWIRSFFSGAEKKKKILMDANLKAAFKLLGSMSYLRGAVMKLGQTFANFPTMLPHQYAEFLGKLHFEAPPMHFTLLRDQLENELGRSTEEAFAEFETEAFAAASLGQVHRARLKTGERVAVKIQYPGIAKTINADFRNLGALLFPLRISRDWANLQTQFDEIREMLELECDYLNEAKNQERCRALFQAEDEIVIPQVYPTHSTQRVLTTALIDGDHLNTFLETNPSQQLRDRFGERMYRAVARLYNSGHMDYGDAHPGNFLFLKDGRLGMLDFGCVRAYDEKEWAVMTAQYLPPQQRTRERMITVMKKAADLKKRHLADQERMDLLIAAYEWSFEPMDPGGLFDFGDPAHFGKGMEIYGRLIRKRYTHSLPLWIWVNRLIFGTRAMLYWLGARVDVRALWHTEEAGAAANHPPD